MKKIRSLTCFALLVLLLTTTVFASTLSLKIKADKTKVKKNDEVTIEVNWEQDMQAADFSLYYDAQKLEFVKSDIEDMFINKEEAGKIKTVWVSMDDTNRTNIKYTFKVIKEGKMEFSTKVEGGFANGQLEMPTDYEDGKLTIGGANLLVIIIIIVAVLVLICLALAVVKNKKKTKK